jgi:predicted small integral membrane protein
MMRMAGAAPTPERDGFLPIRTNAFDRGFISVVLLIFIHLLWMRLLEAYLPLWIATVICALLAFVIIRKG